MSFIQTGQWQAHDATGRRKYIDSEERRRFLAAADRLSPKRRALCYTLDFTGCRVSEALSMGPHQISPDGKLVLRTLKRRRIMFRVIPIPLHLADMLLALPPLEDGRFWDLHRATAWRQVSAVMAYAEIEGPMASCKGLRHGFGVRAIAAGVPQSLVAKWLGHASMATTAIYLDAVGPEERAFARRMW
ncbi:MAG: integrase/recombinase XerD [Sphingomonadales bacterium]|jgi:integrase|nr:integrase/recombinase XerD [Sphingomonadales bacterium]